MKRPVSFWWQWAIATGLGFWISLYWVEVGEKPDIGILEGAIGGAIVGLLQWLVLQRHYPRAHRWGLVSGLLWAILGGSGLGAMGWVAPRTEKITLRLLYGLVSGAQVGTLLGLGKWLTLYPKSRQAGRWMLVHALCWAIALALGWAIGGKLHQVTDLFLGEVVGLGITWALVGNMTGIALTQLLRES